jgi:predicted transglutaminase-like cysteine proteinase
MSFTIFKRQVATLGLTTLVISLTACATTTPTQPTSRAMVLSAPAAPPPGFASFCLREPEQCALGSSDGRSEAASTDVAAQPAFNPSQTLAQQVASADAMKREASRLFWEAAFSRSSTGEGSGDQVMARLELSSGPASLGQVAPLSPMVKASQNADEAVPTVASAPLAAKVALPVAQPTPFGGLTMTKALWDQVNAVNRRVNRSISPRSDTDTYGLADYWAMPLLRSSTPSGDCEDIVLEKKRALRSLGITDQALDIALVTTWMGESHAVLLLVTDQGEYVLDNLTPAIRFWSKAGYVWHERQVGDGAFSWAQVAAVDAASLR